MDETPEPRINWRFIYGIVLAWLIVMILLMHLLTRVFS